MNKFYLPQIFILTIGLVLYVLFDNIHFDLPLEDLKEGYTNSESKFIQLKQGFNVHYRDEGNKDLPILVLIHGTASSLHTWDTWTELMKNDFRIIRMDLPGFGLTGIPSSPERFYSYSLLNLTDFLKDFLDTIGVGNKKISIAGSSLGGGVAWLYSGMHPHQVEKQILIGSMCLSRELVNFTLPFGMKLLTIPIVDKLVQILTPRLLMESSLYEVYYNDSKVTPELVDRYHDLVLFKGNREALVVRTQFGFIEDDNSDDLYDQIRKQFKGSTLIQWGKEDLWIKLDSAYKLQAAFPNSKLVVYDNAGHVPHEEIPEETSKEALKFLHS